MYEEKTEKTTTPAGAPKVSIVIPVYNGVGYLEQCLDSLLAQTMPDFEIICIDDGSTDGSFELLVQYQEKDARFKTVRRQGHLGPAVARNSGIAEARGEYLFFMDADDFAEAQLLEKAVGKADEVRADIVIWDIWNFNDQRKRRQHPAVGTLNFHEFDQGGKTFNWKDNPDHIFNAFQNWAWNKLFRTQFVKDKGLAFQEDLFRTEDLMFTATALVSAERMACIYDRLIYYRILRSGSAMATKEDWRFDFLTAFKTLKAKLEDMGIYEDVKRSFVDWALAGSLFNLLSLNSYDAAKEVFDALKAHGFRELDVLGHDEGFYLNEHAYGDLQRIMALSFEEYLFGKVKDYEKRIEGLFADFDEQEDRADTLARELDETRPVLARTTEELQALAHHHSEIMGAAEQKVGQAICYLPRLVQRGFSKGKAE